MPDLMNRNSFKNLTRIRLREARALLRYKLYDGAYYLCGYAIECALKACIAKKTKKFDFPPKPKIINDIYTHSMNQLVKVAGMDTMLSTEMSASDKFASNWAVVKDWTEESRYEKHDEMQAKSLYSAVTSRKHGVLKWIRLHW